MPLNPKFTTTKPTAAGYVWVRQSHGNLVHQQALADDLAVHIVRSKFSSATHIFQAWSQKHTTGQANAAPMKQILEATIKVCIGTQAQPKVVDHRQGWVAEHLWYFLVKGSYPDGNVAMVFDVGMSPTDPGGDGLVIHRTGQDTFIFRLWEIKKVAGETDPNATISRASGQLEEQGLAYLSRYVVNSQEKDLPQAEKEFINLLMDKWVAKSDDSAAGVSVVCSAAKLTNPSFASLSTKFPKFSSNGTLEGRTVDLEDFVSFCEMVCESLWKGI
ncbi:MAG TPA: hypothetical protein VIG33_18340 [Pseudobdellovibrionaceae bacterium]|jgi:hypothetical protein